MRRVVIGMLGGLLLINAVGVVVGIVLLERLEKDAQKTVTINESLLVRANLYLRGISLAEGMERGISEEAIYYELRGLENLLQRCYGCHHGEKVMKALSDLEEMIQRGLKRPDPSNISGVVDAVNSFSSYAFERAMASGERVTGQFSTTLLMVKRLVGITVLGGLVLVGIYTFYSLRRIESLDRQLKEREKTITEWANRWQETFDAVKEMIVIVDRDCRVINYNRAAGESLRGLLLSENFCRALGLPCPCNMRERIRLGDRVYDTRVYKVERPEGWCIFVFRDVTKEVQMEEELRRAERLSALGTMAAGIAHEVSNPLTGVIGYTELLLSEEGDERKKAYLEKLMYSATRIERVVKNVLSFASIGTPKQEDVDLGAFLDEWIQKNYSDLEGIEILKEFYETGSVKVDRGLIEVVLRNLIDNAIEAMRDSGIGDRIQIRTFRADNTVKIEVSDNGPGIREEILKRIFDPFFTTKEPGKGTGLGLSIVHSIITAHGGQIRVYSREGEGTTFTISLPFA